MSALIAAMSVRSCGMIATVPDLIAESIQRLAAGGVRLDAGLSDEEVSRVQDRLGFTFGPEHREFIQSALPVGKWWQPCPVFSVHQTEAIFYGDNLLDYVAREFRMPPLHPSERTHVPFWSDLSEGAENRDL